MYRFVLIALAAAILAACGSPRGQRGPVWPYPEEPRPGPQLPREPVPGMPSPVPQPGPQIPTVPAYPRSAEEISGAAVLSLLRQSRQYGDAGQPDQAAAALERALRIEPRNYFVWSALAQSYLQRENYEQAESVAMKSNSLARGNLYVELENWKTVNLARLGRGDIDGALQAQARAEEIERALMGE